MKRSCFPLVLVALASSCMPAGEAAPAEPPLPGTPAHEFGDPECDTLSGRSPTDKPAAAEGIAEIAWSVEKDGGRVTLDAFAPNDTQLGTATITYDVQSAGFLDLLTTLEYAEGSAVARQTTRTVVVGEQLRHTTTHELGDDRAVLWWTTTPDFAFVSATLAFPTAEAPDPDNGIVRLPSGTFRTLVLMEDGERTATDEEVAAFKTAAGGDVFDESVLYRHLGAVVDDLGWLTPATAEALGCFGVEAAAVEEERGLRDPNSTSSALSCDKNLLVAGTLGNALGTVGTLQNAAKLAGAAVAAGAVGAGAGAGLVFAGSAIAIVAVGIAIEKAVLRNKGKVAGGLAFVASGGDAATADAVGNFYGGGGSSSGDPHLTTHDGQSFDFQGAGEYVLVRSSSGDFELQARQTPWNSPVCSGVAYNRAIAVRMGAHRVTVDVEAERKLRVDGMDVDLIDEALFLDDGTTLLRMGTDRLILQAPTGESLFMVGSRTISVYVKLPSERAGTYSGVLGDFDGDTANDLVGMDGALDNVTFEDIHGSLAQRWAVTAETSLFDYADGESPDTWFVAGYPVAPLRVDDLPDDARTAAEEACADVTNSVAFEDCVIDIGCSLDAEPAFRAEFLAAHELRNPPTVRTEIRDPVQFFDWEQQGPPGNGEWNVAEDGLSVTQTQNNKPTLFVSGRDYFDVRIDGTLRADGSDDDQIGFVFGYQAPLAAPDVDGGPASDAGTTDTEIKAFVVTWKAGEQMGAPEGLRLLHVHGDLDAEGADPLFWTADAAGAVDVLAEDIGAGTGWRQRPARFSLLFTEERVEVWMDGELRMALNAADSPWPFEPGRFGFFNYSQPNTTYADFSVGPPSPEPSRTRCTLVFDHPDGTEIASDVTWGRSCDRYVLTRNISLTAGGVLHLLPGTEVAFEAGRFVDVRPGAAFEAAGTASAPVRLVGTEPVAGHWGGVAYRSDSSANRLEHVEVSDTGRPGFQGKPWALLVTGDSINPASADVNHTTFRRHSGELAVKVYPGSNLRTFSHNRFEDVAGVPLEVPVDTAERVTADNVFNGGNVARPNVRIEGGSTEESRLTTSATWEVLDVPWLLEDVVRVVGADTVLTLPAGTRFQGDELGALAAETGAISAVGTAAKPIVFTGVTETPGAWRGLYFQSDLSANVLENVEVSYAGASGFQFETTAIIVTGLGTTPGRVTLRNSTVRDSAGSAVLVRSGGTFVEENNTYTSNAGGDVLLP